MSAKPTIDIMASSGIARSVSCSHAVAVEAGYVSHPYKLEQMPGLQAFTRAAYPSSGILSRTTAYLWLERLAFRDILRTKTKILSSAYANLKS